MVRINFQQLSGNPHREAPHRWIAAALHEVRPALPSPPDSAAWSDTLTWLQNAEAVLTREHILIAIDEIERLQTGIEEGWTSAAFLDFLRAAGDSLRRTRLLLVCAHPLHRLGRAWTDRLISVIHREITYLAPEEAEALLCDPMPGFPEIYPPGGVARIVRDTNGHPYLVQLVADALIRNLNGRSSLSAKEADLTRALDRALTDTPFFQELWSDRTEEERELLLRLAEREPLTLEASTALKELVHGGYVTIAADQHRIAVPLFRTWIQEHA